MGTIAETAIIDYQLLFADQQNKLLFSVSACSKQTEVCLIRFLFAEKTEVTISR
jgi:hypothetical protein